jgi:glycosyltransferase involved in cell wall biosynthesis
LAARDLVIAILRLRRLLIDLAPRTALGFLDISNIALLVASAGLPIHVAVSDRNDPDHHHRNTWLLRCVKRVLYARASLFVAQTGSAAVRASVKYRIPTAVVPNVLLVSPNGSSCRLKQISSLGRLVPVKGQRTLLRAFAQSSAPSLGWGLVVAGMGPDRRALESLAISLGIAPHVKFISRFDNPVDLYSSSGIFVLSSHSEGFPNVLLEAMACACPVIATDCPSGPSDLIEHGRSGFLVPVGDMRAMAHAIDALVGDHELRLRIGACASAEASQYSKDRIMQRWNAVLSHI